MTDKTPRPKAAVTTSHRIKHRSDRLRDLTDRERIHQKMQFIALWLRYDAERHGEKVEINVDATGNLHFGADVEPQNLKSAAGWFYRGYHELARQYGPKYVRNAAQNGRHRPKEERENSVEYHLRREANSQIRAEVRRFEKTKEAADLKRAAAEVGEFWRRIEEWTRMVDPHGLSGPTQYAWIDGQYIPMTPGKSKGGIGGDD